MQKLYFLIIGIVVLVLLGGIGFLLLHQNNQSAQVLSANRSNQKARPQGFRGGRGFRNIPAGMKPIFGQITDISGNTVTIQGRNGSLAVNLTTSTKYTGGVQSDLKVNDRIFGYGSLSSDGSITAQQISINPSFPGRGQNSNGGGSSGTTQNLSI